MWLQIFWLHGKSTFLKNDLKTACESWDSFSISKNFWLGFPIIFVICENSQFHKFHILHFAFRRDQHLNRMSFAFKILCFKRMKFWISSFVFLHDWSFFTGKRMRWANEMHQSLLFWGKVWKVVRRKNDSFPIYPKQMISIVWVVHAQPLSDFRKP